MKGLLQSKIFRKNLKKWLCMYVGALLLLTTVITYSKYISKFNKADGPARITMFDVSIENIQILDKDQKDKYNCTKCKDENNIETDEICCTTAKNYRPTTPISYDFIVRPKFEVNTLLATTIHLNTNFNALTLVDNSSNALELYDDSKKETYKLKTETQDGKTIATYTNEVIDAKGQKITITRTITKLNDENNTIQSDLITISRVIDAVEYKNSLVTGAPSIDKTYSITVKYNYNEETYSEEINSENQNNPLSIIKVGYSATQVR